MAVTATTTTATTTTLRRLSQALMAQTVFCGSGGGRAARGRTCEHAVSSSRIQSPVTSHCRTAKIQYNKRHVYLYRGGYNERVQDHCHGKEVAVHSRHVNAFDEL